MAHVLNRHRGSQQLAATPARIVAIFLPVVVLIGTLLGKYRGNWPGAPANCRERQNRLWADARA